MKRRLPLGLAATAVMFVLAALASSRQQAGLLVLEWAARSDAPKPPTAVLIEMGVTDKEPRAWNGRGLRPRRHPLGRLRRLHAARRGPPHRTEAFQKTAGELQGPVHAGVRRPVVRQILP